MLSLYSFSFYLSNGNEVSVSLPPARVRRTCTVCIHDVT